jgi:DNA-binding transcriptional LysR family regulator
MRQHDGWNDGDAMPGLGKREQVRRRTALDRDIGLQTGEAAGRMANLPGPRLLARATPSSKISVRSNSLTNVIPALKAGLGIAILPCFAGDSHEDLVRCLPPIAALDNEQWLVVREEVKSAPCLRAFVDPLAEYIRGHRAMLAGEPKT